MKQKYDFSKGKRGRVVASQPEPQGKTRITIRLDEELVDYFLKEADKSGGTMGYQTLINDALRQFIEGKAPKIEETLRRVVREEWLANRPKVTEAMLVNAFAILNRPTGQASEEGDRLPKGYTESRRKATKATTRVVVKTETKSSRSERLAALGGTMPNLKSVPRRRVSPD